MSFWDIFDRRRPNLALLDLQLLPSTSTGTAKSYLTDELTAQEQQSVLKAHSFQCKTLSRLSHARSQSESRKNSKAYVWLERLSGRVAYYSTVPDVLLQHNLEYVSLVRGAFKFLFVVSLSLLIPRRSERFLHEGSQS